jgi:hypothetical protein
MKKFFGASIEGSEIMSRKEALKALASSMKHLQTSGKLHEVEIHII